MTLKVKITEKSLTLSIRQLLKMFGIFHWKVHQGFGSTPGVSDILGVWKGRMLAIEVKAPRGKPTPVQTTFLKRIENEGGIAILAYSVDDVIRGLNLENRFLQI